MMKNAWSILAAVGVVGMLSASGCVVGSGSDEDGGSGGITKGGGGSGGSTGGSGGSTGATGGTGGATGGTGGDTGGTGGATGGTAGYTCGATGTPTSSCTGGSSDPTCATCIETKCCTEFEACLAPENPCGWGTPSTYTSEIECMNQCFLTETTQNGLSADDAKAKCGTDCVSPTCGTISSETSELFACLETNCLVPCLQ